MIDGGKVRMHSSPCAYALTYIMCSANPRLATCIEANPGVALIVTANLQQQAAFQEQSGQAQRWEGTRYAHKKK